MLRRSKYEMIPMDAATKLVIDKARARVPLGLLQVDVKGTASHHLILSKKTLNQEWYLAKM